MSKHEKVKAILLVILAMWMFNFTCSIDGRVSNIEASVENIQETVFGSSRRSTRSRRIRSYGNGLVDKIERLEEAVGNIEGQVSDIEWQVSDIEGRVSDIEWGLD